MNEDYLYFCTKQIGAKYDDLLDFCLVLGVACQSSSLFFKDAFLALLCLG